MTEEAQDRETMKNDSHDDMESQIKAAMSSRVSHFKEQADSLTFEGVRRLLEKDLGLETYALDAHKKFIKQCLVECMDGDGDKKASNTSGETAKPNVCSTKGEKSPEGRQSTKDVKETLPEDAEKMEDSPVLGLLTESKTPKSEAEETKGHEKKEPPSESIIKKAMRKRAAYVKANSEKITLAGLRRILEEDLKLDKFALDPYKKFISEELDEVLRSDEVLEPSTLNKKKNIKNNSHTRASKKVSSEGSSDSSDGPTEEEEEENEGKPRKKIVSKGMMQNSKELKKRKRPEKETKVSSKKQNKAAKAVSEDSSSAEDSGTVSDDDPSQSSAEKIVKKKEVSTLAYGKRVEHLKMVIKSCGMSVPPSVYKKVKQVPENKREAQLIKELEDILSKEGLSSNPSEKEIKEVKRRKERAKELEGIDTSNIVSSSRRRSTTSFIPPPKPKIPDISDSSDSEDSNDDDDNDSDNDDDENNEDHGNEDGDDGSQSEELNEEDEDSG